MPKLVSRSKSERQSISFRHGQIDALSTIAREEGHGNLSLVIQNIADAEIKRRLGSSTDADATLAPVDTADERVAV